MAFQTALSGLSAAQDQLNVTGNNISNSSTTGFKYSRAEFGDIYASSFAGGGNTNVGSGVKLNQVAQQFSQGNLSFTNNNLDLAISGQGFFVTHGSSTDQTPYYTRAGGFSVDKSGYVVNAQGHVLQVSNNGQISNLQINTTVGSPAATANIGLSLNLDAASSNTALKATTTTGSSSISNMTITPGTASAPTYSPPSTISVSATPSSPPVVGDFTASGGWTPSNFSSSTNTLTLSNGTTGQTMDVTFSNAPTANAAWSIAPNTFNASDTSTYNFSTSTTTYDSLGTAHTGTLYFQKAGVGKWNAYMGMTDSSGNQQIDGPQTLTFASDGKLSPAATTLNFFPSGSGFTPGAGASPMNLAVKFDGSTQYGSSSSVNSVTQDGYTIGELSGVNIDSKGAVTAQYTNGSSDTLGTVALANFANPQGLQQVGNADWQATSDSGSAVPGTAGVGTLGQIQSGALEDSNVDLSKQLVNMILAQRNYQANAKMISTQNQIEQTIMNIQ